MENYYEIKFDHYDTGPVYYRDKVKCLFDPIRETLILETPEEIVRQKFIKFMIAELGIPKHKIQVEVPVCRFKKGAKGRADIVVYGDLKEGQNVPILIVECKAPSVSLIDDVWDQVDGYDKILGAGAVIVTNGIQTFAGNYNNNIDGYELLKKLPNYNELLSGELIIIEDDYEPWIPPKFVELDSESNVKLFREYGWIGEDTDPKFYPLIMNMACFINNSTLSLHPRNFDGLNIVNEGYRNTHFGNAGGGGFEGIYKYFIVQDKPKNHVILSVSILASGKTVDDPFWGTRKGNTILVVGIDKAGKKHSSLQLNLDRYTGITDDIYELWHDGTMTVGGIGSLKRSEVVDFIKNREPQLVSTDDKIILGNFNRNVEINWDQENTRRFFTNLLKYSLLRDEIRTIKNKSKHKKKKRKVIVNK